jgi:hypothetical protein
MAKATNDVPRQFSIGASSVINRKNQWNRGGIALVMLGIVALQGGCDSPAHDVASSVSEPAPPVDFEPTIAVQLRPLPDSEGQEYLGEIRTTIEDEINKQPRMKLVDDPADARLLIDMQFYIDKDSLKSGWYFRLQILDTKHDVAIFEDSYCEPGDVDDWSELATEVRSELKHTVQWLKKKLSISRQIEQGKGGVAYLETDAPNNDRITYGRYDFGVPQHKVFVDYDIRGLRNGLNAAALKTSVNQVYRELKVNHAELVNSPEKANVVLKLAVSSGDEKSYVRESGGVAPPAGSYGSESAGAALGLEIKVFPLGKLQPMYDPSASPQFTLQAKGKAPQDVTSVAPELLSLKSFESALGTELHKLKPYLTPTSSEN